MLLIVIVNDYVRLLPLPVSQYALVCKRCTTCALWCRNFCSVHEWYWKWYTHFYPCLLPLNKKFYFTITVHLEHDCQLSRWGKKVNGVLPLSGKSIVYRPTLLVSFTLPFHVLAKMSLLHWLSLRKTRSKAKNTDLDKIVVKSSQSIQMWPHWRGWD